jgi:hypothetical protein
VLSGTDARFALVRDDDRTIIVKFSSLDGFFVGHRSCYDDFEDPSDAWPEPLAFKLGQIAQVDQSLEEELRQGSNAYSLGNTELQILDDNGKSIGFYWIGDVTVRRMNTHKDSAQDCSLNGRVTRPPDVDAAQVWELWRHGTPTATNLWTELPVGRREAWLEVVRIYNLTNPTAGERSSEARVVALDGRNIMDLASFFCAVGEAVNGPGGYFGSNFMALGECARGGFGIDGGFTLRWFSPEVAEQHLSRVTETIDGRLSYMEIILSTLRHEGVEVILEPTTMITDI